jgi:hypothetical protein
MTDPPVPGHNAPPAAPRHIARCPSCGAVLAQEPGSAAQAIDNLYREVTRLREIAELKEVSDRADQERQRAAPEQPTQREQALQEEIRQLRATVARLRATSRVTST